MYKYILGKSINEDKANEVQNLESIGKAAWEFLLAIYKSWWDSLFIDESKTTFRNKVKLKFGPQVIHHQSNNKGKKTVKFTFVSSLPSLIPAKLPKEVNKISKYFEKNDKQPQKKSYTQASSSSKSTLFSNLSLNITLNTLKIKETFLHLQNKKINQVQKLINGNNKLELRINMTTRGSLWKQIIVLMNNDVAKCYLKDSSMYIININCTLKNIKSNIIVDFICIDNKDIVITTNNLACPSDLQEIKKYIKNFLTTDADQISTPRLPQSKLYIKIVGIPYISKCSNMQISSKEVESILKVNHVFNNIVLTSKPRIIKVSPKSDMAIIWINIWDMQNGSNAKKIINKCFNVESFITTVCSANMNLGVLQCKNCWKWGSHSRSLSHSRDQMC